MWEITASLYRLYEAIREGLNGDFLKEKPENAVNVTLYDSVVQRYRDAISFDEEEYRKQLKKVGPGDNSLRKALFYRILYLFNCIRKKFKFSM